MIFTTARNGCWESASIAAGFTPLLQLVCRRGGCTPWSAWLWNDEDGRCSSSLGFHEVSSVENTTFRLRVAPTFLCWGFPSGSLRLMLMVDFPIRCNRSRAYGRDSCCCVIAREAPTTVWHFTTRTNLLSLMRSIFDHDGDGRVMLWVESLLLCHPLPKHHQAWYRTRHPSPSSCSKGSLLDSFETSSPTPFPREVWLGSIIAFSEKECSRLWSRDRTHGMMF